MSSAAMTVDGRPVQRWFQLAIGVACMALIANMQYGWTLFVVPIDQKYHWGRTAIQWAFTLFVVLETWLVPIEGYLVDRFGPRPVVLGGGVLCGLGWVLNAHADSLPMLYTAAAISGLGAGAVYGTCVGNALKWFPERRGLAAGLTAAGFGAGSALTVVPIAHMIKTNGYEAAFQNFGLIQGVGVFLLAWLLADSRNPQGLPAAPVSTASRTQRDFTPFETVTKPVFWVMYALFVMMAAGGLMATAQLGPIAKDFQLDEVPVSLFGITMAALPFALSLDRVLNGLTRPFFGWISDRIGRELTMLLAFGAEGAGILLLARYGQDPVLFVILTGIVFFAWGEIFSLFPSTCADTFGKSYAASNAGLLYTAKGTAALLVPLGNELMRAHGGWNTVFTVAATLNIAAALGAWFLLRPMRERFLGIAAAEAAKEAREPEGGKARSAA